MALDSNVAPLLAQFGHADSCDKGAGSGDILSTTANNTRKAERTQGAFRCHTIYIDLGRRCAQYTGDQRVLIDYQMTRTSNV